MRTTALVWVLALTALAASQTTNQYRLPPSQKAAAPASQDEDDCTLGEVLPLIHDSPASRVERLRNGPRELIERTRLAPHLEVEVVQGGCAHYGVRISFTTEKATPARRRQGRVLQEALRVLGLLQQRTSSSVIPDTMSILAAFEHGSYDDGNPLQDREHPDVTVYVSARETTDARIIEVTYSFVL